MPRDTQEIRKERFLGRYFLKNAGEIVGASYRDMEQRVDPLRKGGLQGRRGSSLRAKKHQAIYPDSPHSYDSNKPKYVGERW
jgi:hypothetical protein